MESISAPNDMCANCGKGEENSNKLKTCTACLLVKYCSRECQAAHRSHHKKECKKRAAELYDEKLFIDCPPREECPICMIPLTLIGEVTERFQTCCGKIICSGCIYAMVRSQGKDDSLLCPFCRTPQSSSDIDEEEIDRLNKLMNGGNAEAFYTLRGYYTEGLYGMPQDHQKAFKLYVKAGQLGCATAYSCVGASYYNGWGVEVDKEKAKHYYELAAVMGYVAARHSLASLEGQAGNHQRAKKHLIIAAKAGNKKSLDAIHAMYANDKLVSKDEYANTLRAYQKRIDEMKSDMRDKAAQAMKDGTMWVALDSE